MTFAPWLQKYVTQMGGKVLSAIFREIAKIFEEEMLAFSLRASACGEQQGSTGYKPKYARLLLK